MRRPLPRFMALGLLLLGASRTWAPVSVRAPAEPEVVIRASEIEGLRRGFLAAQGRAPAAAELAALVQAYVDDEVLHLEALSQGLDRADAVVQRRLEANARFLGAGDAAVRDEAASAMRLHDPVVRRRLVNVMRLRLADVARGASPSSDELARERLRRSDAYRSAPRVRLTQRYLGPAPGLPLPTSLPAQTEAMLARSFGPEFAHAVFSLPLGVWEGPLRSVHGLHRVRVESREEGELPPLPALAAQLRDALVAERDAHAVEQALASLRLRHRVRVEAEPRP